MMFLFLTYNKCIPTPYITLLADKWNSKFEPSPSPSLSPPLPSQLHLTAYYSILLAIFGQQFAYFQSLLNFSMETKDEGEFVLCLETKEDVLGRGMRARTYYVAHQGSRSPAHLIKLDILLPCWALLCILNHLEEIS